MRYWFSSDLHLGHSNILKYCHRPFKDIEEMNEVLITKWNNRVRPEDQIFHLGDFCFKNSAGGKTGEGMVHKANYWENKLNGRIVFIKGNHDRNNSVRTIIDSVVIKYGPHFINMVHKPDDYNMNFAINLVGHVHQNWKFNRIFVPHEERYIDLINVGVDVWNFQPVTWEEIYGEYRRFIKKCKARTDTQV